MLAGLLPKPFERVGGTSAIPTHMNNMNEEEPTRYVDVGTCDYVVDQTMQEGNAVEQNFRASADWAEVACFPFLDASRSDALFRAFYVPTVSEKRCAFNEYCLHRRVEK